MLKSYTMSSGVGDVSMQTGYQISVDYQVVMVQHVAFMELALERSRTIRGDATHVTLMMS